jgi:hypothetical protein
LFSLELDELDELSEDESSLELESELSDSFLDLRGILDRFRKTESSLYDMNRMNFVIPRLESSRKVSPGPPMDLKKMDGATKSVAAASVCVLLQSP